MENTIYISKVVTDAIDQRSGKYRAMRVWRGEWNGLKIERSVNSMSKAKFLRLIQDNYGYGRDIVEAK